MKQQSLCGVLLQLAVVASLLLLSAEAFDQSNFKKCSDNHFCKLHRDLAEPSAAVSPPYVVPGEAPAIRVEGGKVIADIVSELNPKELLTVEFQAYSEGQIVRMRIVEKTPLRQRYEVKDVLMEGLKATELHKVLVSNEGAFQAGHATLYVRTSPFLVEVSYKGRSVLSANSRNLLKFEHSREKAEGDNWELKWKDKTDTQPHGPQSIGLDFSFLGSNHVYGIPERATTLSLNPTRGEGVDSEPYRLFNLDVFEYDATSPFGLYAAIPLMLSHSTTHTAGVFWLNSAETYVDVEKSVADRVDTHWFSESGVIDSFFILADTPKQFFSLYTSLTGTPYLPPLFSIAYHQCRWNYRDEADVSDVDSKFDEHDIPYDVIWLDIEHTDGKRYFTWDKIKFPTPEVMQNNLAHKGRELVTIVDPHIKRDGDYYVHKEATSESLYVKNKDNNDYEGWCWPGSSSWLDFTNPKSREFWAQKFSPAQYKGATTSLYTWIDMNEPSVFSGPETTMPKDNLHDGQIEHRDVHNMYGFYQSMATVDAHAVLRGSDQRPFLLTRSAFAGSQRFAALWTGDNQAKWDHLGRANAMLMTLGLAGMTFVGADVGGFFGNPDTELLVRWYQAGAFYPFFRAHAHIDTKRREPWLFGEPYTTQIREAVRIRYALLPYFYTAFRHANTEGTPVLRPMWVEFPKESNLFAAEDAFMVGPDLLVRPVFSPGATETAVFLPGTEKWFDYHTHAAFGPGGVTVPSPADRIPVFLRAGSIIPRQDRPRRSSWAMKEDPYTLVVALDSKGSATGDLYLDDGNTVAHQAGRFSHRQFTYSANSLVASAKQDLVGPKPDGSFAPSNVVERIVILGLASEPKEIKVRGQSAPLEFRYEGNRVTVRKPDTLLVGDWAIDLTF
eukprot:gnl/Hemi2/2362_TR835_c0_g1_i2.p1 gnl/Hemi2/2362_TR835_c0_g1~~gnl/Hemi2/2362_TR835_c0_g1_i2.p1  ORF type:complete len:894 (+),score=296.09 gnl/Hemi2/2362_TR835_c0_g1_i2:162-2843(+)